MTREESIIGAVGLIVDEACEAMAHQDPDAAAYKLRVAHNIVSKEVHPVVISDYDLDSGVVYLADLPDDGRVVVKTASSEMVLQILCTILDRGVDALGRQQGLAAGQCLRRAKQVADLAKEG